MGDITCGQLIILVAVEICPKSAAVSFQLFFVKQKMSIIWSFKTAEAGTQRIFAATLLTNQAASKIVL